MKKTEPIYDPQATIVGWLHGDVIFGTDFVHRAFIHRGSVHSYRRKYLGRFDRGYFRDLAGDAVAFVVGATGWPLLPQVGNAPIPRVPPISPFPPVPTIPPIAAFATPNWSKIDWEIFLLESDRPD